MQSRVRIWIGDERGKAQCGVVIVDLVEVELDREEGSDIRMGENKDYDQESI